MSGVGSGYLTGNMLVAYPFEDDQCLAWSSESLRMQQALQRCFVDAGIHVMSHSMSHATWPVIGAFSISDNNLLSFWLGVGDDYVALNVALSSTATFPIISGTREWGSYVIVVSSEGITDFIALCKERDLAPPVPVAPLPSSLSGRDGAFTLKLCPKCVTVRPVGLTSIRVFDGVNPKDEGPHFILKDDIDVRPGNNMQYLESDDTDNGFELNATPGAGLGRVPCVCQEVVEGNAFLAGPDGHARLFNDTCYDVEVMPKYVNDDGVETQDLQFHVKCTSCCTCSMYESIVNDRLVPLAELVRQAKASISDYAQSYESAVRKFNDRIARPILSDVTLSLAGMPIGANVSPKIGNKKVSGNMSRCTFSACVRNSAYVPVIATVSTLGGSDPVVEATASWSDKPGDPLSMTSDSTSGVLGSAYTLYPGRSLFVTFITEKEQKVSRVSTGGFSGKFAVDLSYQTTTGSTQYLGRLRKDAEV